MSVSLRESSRTFAQMAVYSHRLQTLHKECANAVQNDDDDTARNLFADIQFSQRQMWLLFLDLLDERPDLSWFYEEARATVGPENADSALIARVLYP